MRPGQGDMVGHSQIRGTNWSLGVLGPLGVVLTSAPSAAAPPSRPQCSRTFGRPCGDRCAGTPPAEGLPAAASAASGTGSFTGLGHRVDRSRC